MIGDFIDTQLAQIDSLDELKVTLVALLLLTRKGGDAATLTEAEIAAHPAVRDGLRFPSITLPPALQLAVARGTLLAAQIGGEALRYLRNDAAGRRTLAALEHSEPAAQNQAPVLATLLVLTREIERLEHLQVYAVEPDDAPLVEEWLDRGYTVDEMLGAVRAALLHPRSRAAAPRRLRDCQPALFAAPPAAPSEYLLTVITRKRKPDEAMVALRLRLGRAPSGREFNAVRAGVAMFGMRATLGALGRLPPGDHGPDVSALLGLLSESESAALAQARAQSAGDEKVREVVQLYEQAFGLPPTSLIADEIRVILQDVPDATLWRSVFDYAARQNKKSWPYIKKILLNPSPDVFTPDPVNDTARFAFAEYRKRVNRILDGAVAQEINAIAQTVTDIAQWTRALDIAARANRLRWDYIKTVLTSPQDGPGQQGKDGKNGKRQPTRQPAKGGSFRRPQVSYTDEQRAAAKERDRKLLEERKKRAADNAP